MKSPLDFYYTASDNLVSRIKYRRLTGSNRSLRFLEFYFQLSSKK